MGLKLILLGVTGSLVACGGGGSGSPATDCEAMCNHAVNRIVICGYLDEREENQSKEDCYKTVEEINRSPRSCQDENNWLFNASCTQIHNAYYSKNKKIVGE